MADDPANPDAPKRRGETRQEHSERMRRWALEDAAERAGGKRRPLPQIRFISPSGKSEPPASPGPVEPELTASSMAQNPSSKTDVDEARQRFAKAAEAFSAASEWAKGFPTPGMADSAPKDGKWRISSDAEARFASAANECIEAGRKIERRLWVTGILAYFGIPFAVWLASLILVIVFDAPVHPVGGFWGALADVRDEMMLILASPFRFVKAIATVAGFAIMLVGAAMFAAVWFGVVRDKLFGSRK